ncbi:hypothetical protein Nepgr_004817 [Nepenthes gracilis]|uniref:Uncharacterized protein n=1 Tax=Nepenthes gracilis TaxID=150966 RepID=A0AAD3S1Y8_NEPGR|nr:hypothetical protein Nepgr_004817 [Nepenthes gracilis]
MSSIRSDGLSTASLWDVHDEVISFFCNLHGTSSSRSSDCDSDLPKPFFLNEVPFELNDSLVAPVNDEDIYIGDFVSRSSVKRLSSSLRCDKISMYTWPPTSRL